jgi:hypothetical protein
MPHSSAQPRQVSQPPEEHRRATRFLKEPDTEYAVIWRRPGCETLVQVHDESLTGLGLIVADAAPLGVGVITTIIYQGEVLAATVRHVRSRPDGTFLVGLECHRCQPRS